MPLGSTPRMSGFRRRLEQAKLVDRALLIKTDKVRSGERSIWQQELVPNSHRPATRPATAPSKVKNALEKHTRRRLHVEEVEDVDIEAQAADQPTSGVKLTSTPGLPPADAAELPAAEPAGVDNALQQSQEARLHMAEEAAEGARFHLQILAEVLRIVLAWETDESALLDMSASLPKVTRTWRGSHLMQHAPWSAINLLELVFGREARYSSRYRSRSACTVRRCVEVLQAAGPAAASMSGELRCWWPELHHPMAGSHRFRLLGLRHQQFYETGLHETGLRIWPLNFLLVQFLWSRPELVTGRTCLELGAGVAVLSVAAMVLKPSLYVATEISTRCRKLAAINMALSSCSSDVALLSSLKFSRKDAKRFVQGQQTLPFGFHSKRPLPTGKYSMIVGCEIVYEHEVVGPLWAAIQELLSKTKESIFILGYYVRSTGLQEDLLTQAAVSGFYCEEVPPEQYLPVDARKDFMKKTLGIASDEEWTAAFMNNWRASHFHIYLFRWAPESSVSRETV